MLDCKIRHHVTSAPVGEGRRWMMIQRLNNWVKKYSKGGFRYFRGFMCQFTPTLVVAELHDRVG